MHSAAFSADAVGLNGTEASWATLAMKDCIFLS
jgi:hypothetical protein